MKQRKEYARLITNDFLSAFSIELALMLHAGLTESSGLSLLAEDEPEGTVKALLGELAEASDCGLPLSQVLEEKEIFPDYMVQMVATGERSGRLEEALRALSEHYERRRRLNARIRTALLYPAILLLLMLVVVLVLIVKILPAFNQVYQQLGSSLTGLGGGLLRFGQALTGALPVLAAAAGVLVLGGGALALVPGWREAISAWYGRHFGGKGLNRMISASRVASAMAMGMNSGLPVEESLRLAASFQKNNPSMSECIENCLKALNGGSSLGQAMLDSELFPAAYCRMLNLGIRSGAGDKMMTEVAERLDDDAQEAIERTVGRIEPALVVISSVVVGVVILSVMLPLMNIMSSIG